MFPLDWASVLILSAHTISSHLDSRTIFLAQPIGILRLSCIVGCTVSVCSVLVGGDRRYLSWTLTRFSDQHRPSPNNSKLVGFLMLVVVATMTRMAKRVRCKFIKCHFNGAIYPIGWESNMGQGSTRIVGDDGDNDNIHIYNRTIIDTLDRPKVTSLPQ